MQTFTIPQFIDVEDKIIGPITVRQFIILLVGTIFIAISYKIFDFSLFLLVAIVFFLISITFAFVKINGRPFHYFILNIIQTFKKPQLRVWNHRNPFKDLFLADEDNGQEIQHNAPAIPVKARPGGSRLKELSLIVDTKGVYQGEEGEEIL